MRSLRVVIARLRASLLQSIGEVTFGMEDGAVSVAGLVFGVAGPAPMTPRSSCSRALIGYESVYRTALQTMGIARAAALAGVLIGRLVTA